MTNVKVEAESTSSNYAESESVTETEDSVFRQQGNRGKLLESKKKLKKVRSIRFMRISSIRSSSNRRGKPQNDENLSVILSSNGTESSAPVEMSDSASPHFMKGTSSSHAKESFQSTEGLFTKKNLTRVSTLKLKRSLTRKLSGRNTDPKRKIKSSRSIKTGTFKDPKSICVSDDQNMEGANDNKPQRFLSRRLSLKPVRFLAKVSSFKSKSSSMEKSHRHISQSPESSLNRATCSSTLKDSHFPDHIELPQEGSGSQGVPAVKVCPYTYCSLHGRHRRDDVPPLKRFVSMRRRMLKTQRSMKIDGRPVARSKQSGNARKAPPKIDTVHSEGGTCHSRNVKEAAKGSNIGPHDTEGSTFSEGGTSRGEDKEKYNLRDYSEVSLGERTYPVTTNFEESTTAVANSDSDIGRSVVEVATGGKKNMEVYHAMMQMSSVQKDAEPACPTYVSWEMQERDDKYMKMWHLVYKHAVLSNTGREENKFPSDMNNQEGNGKAAQSFDVEKTSYSEDHCETGQGVDDENKSVIELVQKAFDEILLSEPEDLSSDDDFKSRGTGSEEEQKIEDKSGEGNMSTTRESPKEETSPKDDGFRSLAEVTIAQRLGSKPDQKAPKSWSNLKKLILLRRFVKALEKVKQLNFRRPRHLPLGADFEAEKVYLKHQSAEEKRRAEEWMLDYALQKVVSKLAPAQRQRVALLVEAFETILPFQDAQNGLLSSASMKTPENQIQSLDDSSAHSKEETDNDDASDNTMPEMHNPVELEERCLEYPVAKTVDNVPAPEAVDEKSNVKQSLPGSYDNGENVLNGNDNIHLAEIKDSSSGYHEEAPTNGMVNEIPPDLVSNLNTVSRWELPESNLEAVDPIGDNGEQFSMSRSLILKGLARSLGSNLVGSVQSSDLSYEPTPVRKERTEQPSLETSTLGEISTHEQSQAPMSVAVEPGTQQEKQNYTGLWYLVYRHMVSDSAENDPKPLIDGADEKEFEYGGSRTSRNSVPHEIMPAMNPDMDFKDRDAADTEVALQKMEAIKMVEEAIDSIIPDHQEDHTVDRQLLADKVTSDDSNSKESNETQNMGSGNGITKEQEQVKEGETASKEENGPKQQLSRSWSNLKKVILLRRFIKALEKVRKFNPRGPNFLPLEPDPEAEKINLRHQDMADRKGTEEWMLDYALQQVVSKLTPARKRKVELLVEAFETVIPTIKG